MRAPGPACDALLLVSFGGPEGMADVMPFLDRVLCGRPVPIERKLAVARHYEHFGGVSPINAQNRELVAALRVELSAHGLDLPIYWGNRHWHPLLADTVATMARDGVGRALAFVTSAYASHASCRQYLEDIGRARAAVGPGAPAIDRLRRFYNHPGFVEAGADRLRSARAAIPAGRREAAPVAFTAHSIPAAMAAASDYEAELGETCGLVAAAAGAPDWTLVYQSRSGSPAQPWLGPDIGDHLAALAARGVRDVVVHPVGFVSDHMEVLYDLDVQARERAEGLGIGLVRAATVGTHPAFLRMIRELVEERLGGSPARPAVGSRGPAPDACADGCCPAARG
jgi:ferrochelatase